MAEERNQFFKRDVSNFLKVGYGIKREKKIGNHSGRKCIFLYILSKSYNDKKLLNSNKIVHGLGREK